MEEIVFITSQAQYKLGMDETQNLCKFVLGTDYSDIPEPVIDHAKRMILDTIGVSLAATGNEDVDIVETVKASSSKGDLSGESPGNFVLGERITLPLKKAVFINGYKAHSLDFDDVHEGMGGHPSAPILPVVLGIGAKMNATGEDILQAFVVGVETELALGAVLNPGLYERGWHPTAILGHIGSAVAAGSLLDLNLTELQHAVGISASQAGGIKGNFGTMTKPYHVARAARSGIEAATLSEAGVTAGDDILERSFGGYIDLFKGSTPADNDELNLLGKDWRLLSADVKKYPCCGSTHAPIDATLSLMGKEDVDPDAIQNITITEHPNRLPHTNNPNPTTGLEAKFSVQYVVARALIDEDIWLDDFNSDAIKNETVRAIMDKVDVKPNEDAFIDHPFGAKVKIELVDGRSYEYRENRADLVPDPVLEQKYRRCANTVLSENQTAEGLQLVRDLENLGDVSDILAKFSP